jgi:hypothetical protein
VVALDMVPLPELRVGRVRGKIARQRRAAFFGDIKVWARVSGQVDLGVDLVQVVARRRQPEAMSNGT